jgi:hypothetical protein
VFSNSYLKQGNQVTIYVGPERVQWILNEDLLCDRAPFFQAAFKSDFREGREKTMELPEDDPKAFAKFVDWVYTNRILCDICDEQEVDSYDPVIKHPNEPYDLELFALWVFADKIGHEELGDSALNRLHKCFWTGWVKFSAEGIKFAYDNTAKSSPLRARLLKVTVEQYYTQFASNKMDLASLEKLSTSHEDFAVDLLKGVYEHSMVNGEHCSVHSCRIHPEASPW